MMALRSWSFVLAGSAGAPGIVGERGLGRDGLGVQSLSVRSV